MFVLTAEAAAAAAAAMSDHSSRTASPIRPSSVVHDNEFPDPSGNVVDVIDLDDDDEDDDKEINIFLRVKSSVPFKVKKTDKIKTLKKYFTKEGVSENLLNVMHYGKCLNTELTFEECNIQDNFMITVVQDTMSVLARKLYIRIPSNKHRDIEVEVNVNDTIFLIISLIVKKFEGDPYSYTLMYKGKHLDSYETLASLGIKCPTTMLLIEKPQELVWICVYTPSNKIYTLQVRKLHTVAYIKAIIGNLIGIQIGQGGLFYGGERLDELKTLEFYSVKDYAPMHLVFPYQVYVKLWKGRIIMLDVLSSDDINDINRKVYEKLQVPVCSHRITFEGKSLVTGYGIGSYGVKLGSTLKMGRPDC